MKLSTKNSLVGRITDYLGVNKKFHKYEKIDIDSKDSAIISPVEAKVMHIGKIEKNGMLISKHNKKVLLKDIIGDYSSKFLGSNYINFYLSPSNKHFWVTPYTGEFTHTQKNEGKSWPPVFIGLENIFGIEMFSKAVKKNASIGSIFQTKDFPLAMVAIGSLNVNRIHTDYEQMKTYKKGSPCGYFSMGSSMLLCFPNNMEFLIDEGSYVKIGQRILIKPSS